MTTMKLENKVVIITGGASGMGEAMCHGYSREGASVVIVDRDKQGAEKVVSKICSTGGTAIAIEADVTSAEQLQNMSSKAADTFGQIDILINNAGARVIRGFLEHTAKDWNSMLDINLSGPFYCTQAVVPFMAQSSGGSVINVCSIASYMGRPNRCAYVAAKSGLLGLTRAMAMDLSAKNIRVNGISPGMIASPFNQRFAEGEETGKAWESENLIGRWGQPDDITGAAIFLASDESRFITGSDIKVEGGWLAARSRPGEEVIWED